MVSGGAFRNPMPMALSNPIFVDVDGNGFKPNMDLLGQPLPSSRASREEPQAEKTMMNNELV